MEEVGAGTARSYVQLGPVDRGAESQPADYDPTLPFPPAFKRFKRDTDELKKSKDAETEPREWKYRKLSSDYRSKVAEDTFAVDMVDVLTGNYALPPDPYFPEVWLPRRKKAQSAAT